MDAVALAVLAGWPVTLALRVWRVWRTRDAGEQTAAPKITRALSEYEWQAMAYLRERFGVVSLSSYTEAPQNESMTFCLEFDDREPLTVSITDAELLEAPVPVNAVAWVLSQKVADVVMARPHVVTDTRARS